ncbi:MAG TPA: single-stranded-DNA-specific exonuclease RecJ [Steroidobacteraceae bacterium]|jgi:single-stranded-DNA-specific exonuclease|nr:single-stranded-DNA-specific exonuclease RecJ [Steroidobacteraceae bacterium]
MELIIERRTRGIEITDLALHPVLRRAYAARGVLDSQQLALTLDQLMPVGTLDSVEAAVALILEHRERRILVIGDFDADGATSTALIVRALRAWGFSAVDFLVPNRFEFGYGLTPEIVAIAAERNPSLIITVDNGISSHAGVAAARARGIQVLVTDHHLPGSELPAADVIVNPNVPGSTFGSRALAGVGVAFYVMAALRRETDARGMVTTPPVTDFLDLVALGTVADLVPLDVNNRVLVAQGIRRIRAGRAVPGIRALLAIGNRSLSSLTAADLGFTIGPRLNAAGRLDDMSIGIRCLLAETDSEALALATRLDELNIERREIEARMQGVALAAVASLRAPLNDGPTRHGVCLFDADWHQGVVGLVASRIKDRIRRPVIAFARNADGSLRGSARSVQGIHIRDVLDGIATRHPELITRFGGHAMAAGLTIEEGHLDAFARAFDEEVTRWRDPSIPANRVETDGELASDEIALDTAQALRDGGPWGQAFPEPCFDGVFAVKNARVVGDKHLKLWVTTGDQARSFDAIAFNFKGSDESARLPEGDVRLVYRLDINEYKGERRLQLLVDHVLP